MGSGPIPAPSPGAPPTRATLSEDGLRGRAYPLTHWRCVRSEWLQYPNLNFSGHADLRYDIPSCRVYLSLLQILYLEIH